MRALLILLRPGACELADPAPAKFGADFGGSVAISGTTAVSAAGGKHNFTGAARQRARLRLRSLPPRAFVIAGVAVAAVLAGCSGSGSGNNTGSTTPARPDSRASESPPSGPTPTGTGSGPGSTSADVLVIAHRGASAYAPQNTVAAARKAVSLGADALEADIRQTRDGDLVALLRPTLAPTTNVEQVFPGRRPWWVESFTLAQVRRLDAGSWFGPEFAGARVPTLNELADALNGSDVKMIVEVKAPRRYPGIGKRVLRAIRSRPGRYREVESFNLRFMKQFARHSPPVLLGAAEAPPEAQLREVATWADAVNVQRGTVDGGYVDRAHRLGLEVKMWSVHTPAQVRQALALGVDGIYSPRPDMVLKVLGR